MLLQRFLAIFLKANILMLPQFYININALAGIWISINIITPVLLDIKMFICINSRYMLLQKNQRAEIA